MNFFFEIFLGFLEKYEIIFHGFYPGSVNSGSFNLCFARSMCIDCLIMTISLGLSLKRRDSAIYVQQA